MILFSGQGLLIIDVRLDGAMSAPSLLGLRVKARSDFISILAAPHNVVVILLYHSIPSDEINMCLLGLVFVSYLSPKGWKHFRPCSVLPQFIWIEGD
jgi:hypothetical protein